MIARYVAAVTVVERVTTAETVLANFIAKSKFPLAIMDDFSKMVGKMFPDSDNVIGIAKKISAGIIKSKTTQIIKGALEAEFNRVSFLLEKIIPHITTTKYTQSE